MSDFPCLELVTGPFEGGLGLAPGVRWPVTDGLVIGRGPDCAVQLNHRSLGRRHLRVEHRHGRWWALDLGASNGALHNGAVLRDAELLHGDTLELPSGLCLAVWFHDPGLDHLADLEAELLAHPDDEVRWQVCADWLLERGLPLGARLRSTARDLDADARFLGALGGLFRGGWLDVEWHFGFPRRVVVRAPGPARLSGQTPGALVKRVLEAPACRFLRHLEVDPLSFGSGLRVDGELDEVLDVLATTNGPRWLETVKLGPLPMSALSAPQRQRFEDVRRRHPQVTTTAERLLQLATTASLEVLAAPAEVQVQPKPGGSAGLVAGESHLIGQLEDCVVLVTAPEHHPASRLAVRVEQENGRWLVEDLAARAGASAKGPLRVNGREALLAHLRDGDLLELVSGLLLRFRVR